MTALERAELLDDLEAIGHAVPQEFCDRHGGYVDEGRTRPYEAGSRYRICDACVDEARRRLGAATCSDCGYMLAFHSAEACPSEAEARAMAGDR